VTYVLIRVEETGACSVEGAFRSKERAQQDVRSEPDTHWHLFDVGDAHWIAVHQQDDGSMDLLGTFATDVDADAFLAGRGEARRGRLLRFRVSEPVENDDLSGPA